MTTDIRAALVETLAHALHKNDSLSAWETMTEGHKKYWCKKAAEFAPVLSAKLAALGLRVVPAEATEEMLTAMAKAEEQSAIHNYGALPHGEDAYAVMLAAYPDPLAAQEASDV